MFPLLWGWVDACWVVGAGVEEDYGAGWGGLEGLEHAGEVEAFGLLVEVGVCGEGEADVGEDLVVVGPCWVREVDGWLVRVEFGEEEAAEVDGAGAGDGLQGADLEVLVACFCSSWWWCTYSLLADGWAVAADDELLRGGGEIGQAADGKVLVVQVGVIVDGIVGLISC